MSNKIFDEINNELKGIVTDNNLTSHNKKAFIKEMKGGLGKKIKNNPSNVNIVKETFLNKINDFITDLFKKI